MRLPQGKALISRDPVFRDSPQPHCDCLRSQAPRPEDAAYGRVLLTRYDDARRHRALPFFQGFLALPVSLG